MKYLCIVLLLTLAACSLTPEEPVYYRLDPAVVTSISHHSGHSGAIYVSMPQLAPGLDEATIQVEEKGSLTNIRHAAWVEAPDEMLSSLFVTAMQNTGLFDHVVDSTENSPTSGYNLETTLNRFTLVKTDDADASYVEVAINVLVTRVADHHVVLSQQFNDKKPVGTLRMTQVIAAYQNCLHTVFEELDAALSQNLHKAGK